MSSNRWGNVPTRRSTRSVSKPKAVAVTPKQIEDARRFLSDILEPDDLNPTVLAQGGKDKVIATLRQAANDGGISGVHRNPPDALLNALYNNTVGLGVLEEFLANPAVEQINVQGPKTIVLQVNGIWTEVTDPDLFFENTRELRTVAANITRRVGKDLSRHTNPIMDIRFERPVLRIHINQTRRDHGIAMYIRRGRSEPFSTDYLLEAGNFNRDVLAVLQEAAKRLIGCVFLGGVGTGKTVMLEKYIDFMPNVPIVVVDDAGDCQPSHRMCAIFDLPETSYTAHKETGLTLGGMTRAALREGDVLVVAETRGAEEAGILISDAPSMRCVVTTAHGENASSGLSRLVSIAQRPPSPYAGTNSLQALRRDLAAAFPLVVQVDRRGNRRFISGIYHNEGWLEESGRWHLRPLVTTMVSDEHGIEWQIVDGNLDQIKAFVGLDRMQVGRISVYESKSPQRLMAEALRKYDEQKWVEAVHLLSQLLKDDPNNEMVRQRLLQALENTPEFAEFEHEAVGLIARVNQLVEQRAWGDARKIIKDMTHKPAVYAIVWRQHLNLGKLRQEIEHGFNESSEASRVVQQGNELLRSSLPWTELKRCLYELTTLDIARLSDELKSSVKYTHASLLVALVKRAPQANAQFYRQQLEDFMGSQEAQAQLAQVGQPNE